MPETPAMLQDMTVVLDTGDVDELRALLDGKGMSLRHVGARRGQDRLCRISVLRGERSYVSHISYGADLDILLPAEAGGYTLSIPLEGLTAIRRNGGAPLACRGAMGGLTSAGQDSEIAMAAGSARLSLSFSREAVEGTLERLSGRHVRGTVDFAPGFRMGSAAGQVVRSAVGALIAQAGAGIDPMADPAQASHFEAMVIGELLLHQPHSHSALLESTASGAVSRDVRRAIDFAHANLDKPLSLADLVEVAGVPARTLNEHFRAVTGFPPMAYLQRQRLNAVRASLMGQPARGVTETALAFGFSHLGRFSAAYRRMFGETPSDTLRRARAR